MEKKGLLFINRKIGEIIRLTVGSETIDVILKESSSRGSNIGIRASKGAVKIERADAESKLLSSLAGKKDDQFAIARMQGLIKGSKQKDSLSSGAYSLVSIKKVPASYMDGFLVDCENVDDIALINNEKEKRRADYLTKSKGIEKD